ncbi:unnamed protein product [Prorocentrum cordatum]|uniref:Transcription factor CBF/NF-Y/archaeal histone domain-containing protein n=1 Tax=Prorocentrum cordatum TaxID=2364126 RepID=A0ABN9RMA7_9DINO|nr:unnamed protein product [Polarella glacialis]
MAGAMAPAGHTFAAGAESLDAPGAEAAAAGEPAKDAEAEDPGLSAITLPREAVRRIARSAAPPGARISSEAVAGLQRVAQAFVLYATDRALAEAQARAGPGRWAVGGRSQLPRRRRSACSTS